MQEIPLRVFLDRSAIKQNIKNENRLVLTFKNKHRLPTKKQPYLCESAGEGIDYLSTLLVGQ